MVKFEDCTARKKTVSMTMAIRTHITTVHVTWHSFTVKSTHRVSFNRKGSDTYHEMTGLHNTIG